MLKLQYFISVQHQTNKTGKHSTNKTKADNKGNKKCIEHDVRQKDSQADTRIPNCYHSIFEIIKDEEDEKEDVTGTQ